MMATSIALEKRGNEQNFDTDFTNEREFKKDSEQVF